MVRQHDPGENLLARALSSFEQLGFEVGPPRGINTDDWAMFVASGGDQVLFGRRFVVRRTVPGQMMALSVFESLLALFQRHQTPTVHWTIGVHQTIPLLPLESRLQPVFSFQEE